MVEEDRINATYEQQQQRVRHRMATHWKRTKIHKVSSNQWKIIIKMIEHETRELEREWRPKHIK